MVLQPLVGSSPLLQFRNLFNADGRTPWTSDQPVTRPLPIRRTTQTQNKRIHRHLYTFERDSYPRSQRSSEGRQFIPYTARPLWPALKNCSHNIMTWRPKAGMVKSEWTYISGQRLDSARLLRSRHTHSHGNGEETVAGQRLGEHAFPWQHFAKHVGHCGIDTRSRDNRYADYNRRTVEGGVLFPFSPML
jgi:hypothetical protein